MPISTSWVHTDYPDIVFADLGPNPILPDGVDTVLEVTLKELTLKREIHGKVKIRDLSEKVQVTDDCI